MKIKNHKLVGIDYKRSPNQSGVITPTYLVLHYTAGRSAESAVNTLLNPKRKASAHLVIGRDGSITQLVPFNRKAWHAGKSTWKDLVGMNAYSLGIELDNCGKLEQDAAGGWKSWFGRSVPTNEVIVAKHKNGGKMTGWHTYSEEQMDSLEEVATALFDAYNLVDVIGHDDIAPGRKQDPGPAFNMTVFRAMLVGRHDEEADWEEEEVETPDFLSFSPNGRYGNLL